MNTRTVESLALADFLVSCALACAGAFVLAVLIWGHA